MSQQRVLLSLDEAAVLPREAGVLVLADLVQGVAQMAQDVELVVQDRGLRGVAFLEGGGAEGLPHVHDGQANPPAFLGAQPGEELVQAGLGAVLATEPDGAAPLQVADDDAVAMPLGDGDLVDADHPRRGRTGPTQLLAHVLLVQLLDRMPIERELLGHLLDGGIAAAPADEVGEPLGIERIVGEPVQPFAFHAATPGALDPTDREGEVDPFVAARQIADAAWSLVVVGAKGLSTDAAERFFRRRWREMTTAWGSPKTRSEERRVGKAWRYRGWADM